MAGIRRPSPRERRVQLPTVKVARTRGREKERAYVCKKQAVDKGRVEGGSSGDGCCWHFAHNLLATIPNARMHTLFSISKPTLIQSWKV